MKEDPTYKLPSTPVEYERFLEWQPPEASCIYEYNNRNIEIDMVPMFCYPCHSTCATCNGPEAEDCTSCINTHYLTFDDNDEPNGCSDQCPDGFYQDTDDNLCKRCSADFCTKCPSDVCEACQEGKFFDPKTKRCRSDCGPGYFRNSATLTCEMCDISEVTTCVDYATKATSCTNVF